MKRAWKILGWSPFPKQPWYWNMQHSLLSIMLFTVLIGWNDNIAHFGAQITEEEAGPQDELPIEAWNVPLDLGNGSCLVITTREQIPC